MMIIGLDGKRCLDFVSNDIVSESDTSSILILDHKMKVIENLMIFRTYLSFMFYCPFKH